MTPKSVVKSVLLATSDIGTTFTVQTSLQMVVNRILPDLKEWDEEWTQKEKTLQTIKVIGITAGIAVAAGVTASVIHTIIDENLWNDDIEVLEPEN